MQRMGPSAAIASKEAQNHGWRTVSINANRASRIAAKDTGRTDAGPQRLRFVRRSLARPPTTNRLTSRSDLDRLWARR